MAASATVARVLRFDSYELNLHAGELRKNGVKLRLQGRPVQLLAILLQNAGTLVTREELRDQLWPADTFVDFDHGLHNAIARIRDVLGDSAESPKYIETLPRRGYRFVAPVEGTVPQEEVPGPQLVPASATTRARKLGRLSWIVALFSAVTIGLVALGGWQLSYGKYAAPEIRSIAVLPLQNMSGDTGQEYFADGMTEELISELSRIPGLKVISHTSVTEYKGTKKHLPQIASELGVDGIIEGSVLRDGDEIRITVQLLDAPHDRHLWSESYRRPAEGVLALQQEVAENISGQIRLKLGPSPAARRSTAEVNPDAYDAYLRGRYFITTGYSTPDTLNQAKNHFEQSAQLDPKFAPAYAGLADSYVNLGFYRQLPPQQAYVSAKYNLAKALSLDDSLGSAHTDLALMNWQYDWDWRRAEQEFHLALVLSPSYDCLHAYHSTFLAWMGDRTASLEEITRARELNPGSSFSATESAAYFQLRDFPSLVTASRKGVSSDPNGWLEHYFLGIGYEGTGKTAEAIAEYQQAVELSHGDQDPTAALGHAYAAVGRRDEAVKILHDLQERSKTSYVSPYMIATVYAGLGDKDNAFALLNQAFQERSLDIAWNFKADLRLDNLRGDARFEALRLRAGFPQ